MTSSTVAGALRECGMAGFVCLLLGVVGAVIGAVGLGVAFRRPQVGRVLGGTAVLFGLAAVVGGLAGRQFGIARVEEVLAMGAVNPEHREALRAQGMAEAGQCLVVGGVTGAGPIILGLLALAAGLAARRKDAPPAQP